MLLDNYLIEGSGTDRLVVEEIVEGVSRLVGTGVACAFAGPIAECEVEVLAEVGPIFFGHWFGSALATLVGDAGVVKDAVEADAQILVASVATLTASRLAVERPLLSAFVTVPCHGNFLFSCRLAKR
jgi:hypothetical protein